MKPVKHVVRWFAVLLMAGTFALPAVAVPITFRFQATVGTLPMFNDDVGLPFTLEEGSVIDGLLTIDPDLGELLHGNASQSIQPHSLDLSFDGFSFGAEMYEAKVYNDSEISDGPNAGPVDTIMLGCSSGFSGDACSTEPLNFPGTPPLSFGLNANFAGDISLLPNPELPSDVAIWNGFSIERTIRFRFVTLTNDVEGFNATMSDFNVVPEPTSVCTLLVSLLLLSPKSHRLNS